MKSNNGRFKATHGLAGTRVLKAWQGMIDRCTKRSRDDWHLYGGRGIVVCDRWLASPRNFLEDMGHPPPGMSLDRIDNSGNYERENCRWATPKEQARNTRQVRLLTHAGETRPMAEWAEKLGIKNSTLHARLKAGWPVSRAVTEKLHGQARELNRVIA